MHPAREVVASANIVAGKEIGSSQSAEENVLGGPAAYTAKFAQTRQSFLIFKIRETLQIQAPLGHLGSRFDDCVALVPAEPKRKQVLYVHRRQIRGSRKSIMNPVCIGKTETACSR